jgi:NADH-quinone oxidoreductase subunit L
LTAFYSWRLLIMAFHGAPRASAQVMSHVHESPKVMTLPLLVLAIGAVFAGWLGYELFVGHDMKQFWGASIFILPTNTAMEDAHHVPSWVKLLPIVLASSWGCACGSVLCLLDFDASADCGDLPSGLFAVLQ